MSVLERFERICREALDDRALRTALLAEVRRVVPFDWYVWLLTDPETSVGAAPLAEVPTLDDLPTLIRLKYRTPVNRWTSLPAGSSVSLRDATDDRPQTSPLWRELLTGYGVDDVLSTVFRDQFGCWGFLDLWRMDGRFTDAEREVLAGFSRTATPALRRCLGRTFTEGAPDRVPIGEPAVLLLSDDLKLQTQTAATEAYLRTLLPTDADRAPVPAAAYNVAAQLLAVEQGVDTNPASARVHLRHGRWLTLRAARMAGTGALSTIAVTIEATPPAERAALYARVIGLSDREAELLHLLVRGADTRELARRMFVSEHTVQDHLKSVFTKAGTRNRRALVARATGTG